MNPAKKLNNFHTDFRHHNSVRNNDNNIYLNVYITQCTSVNAKNYDENLIQLLYSFFLLHTEPCINCHDYIMYYVLSKRGRKASAEANFHFDFSFRFGESETNQGPPSALCRLVKVAAFLPTENWSPSTNSVRELSSSFQLSSREFSHEMFPLLQPNPLFRQCRK